MTATAAVDTITKARIACNTLVRLHLILRDADRIAALSASERREYAADFEDEVKDLCNGLARAQEKSAFEAKLQSYNGGGSALTAAVPSTPAGSLSHLGSTSRASTTASGASTAMS